MLLLSMLLFCGSLFVHHFIHITLLCFTWKVLRATAMCSSRVRLSKYSWNTLVKLDYEVAATACQTTALLLVNASDIVNEKKKRTPEISFQSMIKAL